jgi:hypothetical protein
MKDAEERSQFIFFFFFLVFGRSRGGGGGGKEVSFLRFLINITSISTCLDQNQDMFYKKLLTPYKHLSDMHLGHANTYHLYLPIGCMTTQHQGMPMPFFIVHKVASKQKWQLFRKGRSPGIGAPAGRLLGAGR